MPTVAQIVEHLQQIAPLDLAAEWDNVGLLLGDEQTPVSRIMTCLTVTPESAAEAVRRQAQLIVTHHPIFFRPIQKLTVKAHNVGFLWPLAREGIAVYSPHTAWDNAPGGINDILARQLGLQEVKPLRPALAQRQCKIVVFTPENDLGPVSDALFAAGAGHIGEYSECSYRVTGVGTFFGSEATNPTVGQKGQREEVAEYRLEVICPEEKVPQAIAAMVKAHSYEEPAFDVYPMLPRHGHQGAGRIGRLQRPVPLGELAHQVQASLRAGGVQIVGDLNQSVHTVAIACGAAGEFLKDAAKARANVFLTGEMRFHDYLAARSQGIALLLPGHYATERIGIEELARRLQDQWKDVEVWASEAECDPVHFLS